MNGDANVGLVDGPNVGRGACGQKQVSQRQRSRAHETLPLSSSDERRVMSDEYGVVTHYSSLFTHHSSFARFAKNPPPGIENGNMDGAKTVRTVRSGFI